jgi:hypothetical protein
MHGDIDDDPDFPSHLTPDSDRNSSPRRGFYILVHGYPRRATVAQWTRWMRGTPFGATLHRPCSYEPAVEQTDLYRDGDCHEDDYVVIITEFVGRNPRISPENKVLLWVTAIIGGPENGAKWQTTTLADAKRDHFGAVSRHLRLGWHTEAVPEWAEVETNGKGG